MIDDSPTSLDSLLRGSDRPAQLEPTPGDMPAGMIDAARDFKDAMDAGDHHAMAKAWWDGHSIAHAALTGVDYDDEE
jgi:hypothetical protein